MVPFFFLFEKGLSLVLGVWFGCVRLLGGAALPGMPSQSPLARTAARRATNMVREA